VPPNLDDVNNEVSRAAMQQLGQDCPPESIWYMFQGDSWQLWQLVSLDSWQLCADLEFPDKDIIIIARCYFSKA
jgi:hypothetical protein